MSCIIKTVQSMENTSTREGILTAMMLPDSTGKRMRMRGLESSSVSCVKCRKAHISLPELPNINDVILTPILETEHTRFFIRKLSMLRYSLVPDKRPPRLLRPPLDTFEKFYSSLPVY